MFHQLKIALILFCISSCAGCKIGYHFNEATIPVEAKTATVNLFVNNAPLASPTLPLKITERLKDLIISQSRLNIAQQNGDLVFTGMITGYNIAPVAIQANETAGLNRLTISISVTYVNKFDEKTNFTQNFTRFADYDSSQELSSVEDQLMDEINRQLVQDVFDRAFSNW
ncbi:MAG TPA: LptE family protein [Flavobacteriales bacterium]|nr:LptE family protein [Flavobacteriales bacterium]